jgi:CO/xanthine dehydrogenase FAD-binding subunit
MHPAAFEYARAATWEDAVARLQAAGDEARVIAGGQSLVPMMMLRLAAPSLLIDVGRIEEPRIALADGELTLSALTRHVDLERSDIVRAACPMLAEAAAQIGNVRVRARGTIGGSLAHGEASAELACVALAHEATVDVLGPGGGLRELAAADLFVGQLITSLASGEVITRVRVPALAPGQGSSFQEIARRAGDFAIVEVAAIVSLAGGLVTGARVVLGAVGSRPADHSPAAGALIGRPLDGDGARETAATIAAEAEIVPSSHAGREYRRSLVAVLVARALITAAARAAEATR